VFTDVGDDLVLMRMADAAALLADVPGARVHRSWWVARAAVTGTARDGDRTLLRLENGQTAPVSRSERARLSAAGWF
jgi:DNA-binding LytR/AlgR family response regulator